MLVHFFLTKRLSFHLLINKNLTSILYIYLEYNNFLLGAARITYHQIREMFLPRKWEIVHRTMKIG